MATPPPPPPKSSPELSSDELSKLLATAVPETPTKPKSRKNKIKEKYESKRNQLWPALAGVDPNGMRLLWESSRKAGFVNIPRAMPLMLNIMNYLAPKPVSDTYFALWCRDFGTGFVEINDLDLLALEAGFSGVRATGTLNARLKLLSNETDDGLGFIRAKKSSNGKYKSILILNPMLVIYVLYKDSKITKTRYDELFSRCSDVGDKDLEKFEAMELAACRSMLESID